MSLEKVKELKELGDFLLTAGMAVDKSLSDGKLNWADALNFADVAISAPKAIIGLGQIDEDYFNLDDETRAELVAVWKDKFDLKDDKIEGVVEQVLQAALAVNKAVASVVGAKRDA